MKFTEMSGGCCAVWLIIDGENQGGIGVGRYTLCRREDRLADDYCLVFLSLDMFRCGKNLAALPGANTDLLGKIVGAAEREGPLAAGGGGRVPVGDHSHGLAGAGDGDADQQLAACCQGPGGCGLATKKGEKGQEGGCSAHLTFPREWMFSR